MENSFVDSSKRRGKPVNEDARQKVLNSIGESLPAFFRISEQNVYSAKTIYNMLSQGRGPEVVDIRGHKYLERDSFLSWLSGTATLKRGRKRNADINAG